VHPEGRAGASRAPARSGSATWTRRAELARLLPGLIPVEAECEYRVPVELGDAVMLRSLVEDSTLRTWMVSERGVHASALVRARP
jgi:acyl-CoA thioesterase FadM